MSSDQQEEKLLGGGLVSSERQERRVLVLYKKHILTVGISIIGSNHKCIYYNNMENVQETLLNIVRQCEINGVEFREIPDSEYRDAINGAIVGSSGVIQSININVPIFSVVDRLCLLEVVKQALKVEATSIHSVCMYDLTARDISSAIAVLKECLEYNATLTTVVLSGKRTPDTPPLSNGFTFEWGKNIPPSELTKIEPASIPFIQQALLRNMDCLGSIKTMVADHLPATLAEIVGSYVGAGFFARPLPAANSQAPAVEEKKVTAPCCSPVSRCIVF